MGKEKEKEKGKEPKDLQKKTDAGKQPPKKRTLKGKLFRFVLFLVIAVILAGVGHFYKNEKRLPKTVKDVKVIAKNISTFFISTTNLAKEKWKELGLDKRTEQLVRGFEKLLKAKKTSVGSGAGTGSDKTPAPASVEADPSHLHLLKSKEYFDEGKGLLKKFGENRNQADLNNAKKAFFKSQGELEKAKGLTKDSQQKETIDQQLSEVGKLISDCNKMGSM